MSEYRCSFEGYPQIRLLLVAGTHSEAAERAVSLLDDTLCASCGGDRPLLEYLSQRIDRYVNVLVEAPGYSIAPYRVEACGDGKLFAFPWAEGQ